MLVMFADTDMDFTAETAKKYGYRLISMPYMLNGKSVYPYEDEETVDLHAYYDELRHGALPNTSGISPQAYIRYFEPVFAAGDDIFYVHFSSAMTNTFQFMETALKQLKEKYPERKFYEVDTLGISALSYAIATDIAALYQEGKTAEEMLAWAEKEVQHYAIYFTADDLKFFGHSGRVSGISATMGNLLGIRPIIHVNSEGKMVSIGKERGRRKAIGRLIEYVKEMGDDVANHRIVIGHSDNLEMVDQAIALLKETFGENLDIEVVEVNPTIGGHCGPDDIGICFHALHR